MKEIEVPRMNPGQIYELMADYLNQASKSADKLYDSHVVAQGRSARKSLQNLITLCKSERNAILDVMKFLSAQRERDRQTLLEKEEETTE